MLIFTSHGTFPELTADGLISLDQRITLLPPQCKHRDWFHHVTHLWHAKQSHKKSAPAAEEK